MAKVRRLLSDCSETFNANFDAEIVRVLGLVDIRAYGHIIDSFYLFEDTELAKDHIRVNPMGRDFGLAYLKFYGVMNACYLQQQAAIVCSESLKLEIDLSPLHSARVVQFRNDFAAHSPNRGRGAGLHSFILDKFGLVQGRVSGYSSNAPDGFVSRDAKLTDLVSEWDAALEPVLGVISCAVATRINGAGVHET
ncbi:hypothetical protein HK414_19000 [Ramlibacter terrae]|uniref:Uncharacterized protein n=1 Tax=Ramlibacter terrae TaxID=2732511 RepID=A0ABX6P4B8_9BURK|nr:hypothetical protein HK414_19000 [Ramlibacter terrae]